MNTVQYWFKNARYRSLAQSVMPAILAAVMASNNEGFVWWTALLAIVGVAMAHLAMNLADDWFDYRVDMLGDRDKVTRQGFRAMMVKYPYLSSGEQTLKSTALAIAAFLALALGCGLAIWWKMDFNWSIPLIVAICGFLGAFYSAPPLKLAYRGLGELVIGIIFGPLLMSGVYVASCGSLDWGIVLTGIPVGMLVTDILFTHSFIDLKGDEASNKMTFARLLGSTGACLTCSIILIFVPFLLVVLAVCTGYLHPAYLAVLVMLPRGVWLFRSLLLFGKGELMEVERPEWWLGSMPDWKGIRAAGIDWFMIRWLTARNLLSGFCFVFAAVAIILRIIG